GLKARGGVGQTIATAAREEPIAIASRRIGNERRKIAVLIGRHQSRLMQFSAGRTDLHGDALAASRPEAKMDAPTGLHFRADRQAANDAGGMKIPRGLGHFSPILRLQATAPMPSAIPNGGNATQTSCRAD